MEINVHELCKDLTNLSVNELRDVIAYLANHQKLLILQDQQRILKKRKLTLDELASHYQGLSFCKTVEAATDNCYGFSKFYKDIMSPTNTVGDAKN